ncbi:MAG: hypothetical protein ABSF03_17195 [Streptosporangiaceae bacterium]
MSDRPRIELNTVQVVASMAAAVTGAVLTSYLGDGGTIVGTAVGSGASTAGFAVYKHYLARTKEKVTPVIVQRARQWGPVSTTQAQAPRGTTQASRGSPADGASPGTGRTQDPATRTGASPYRGANGGNGPTAGRYASGGAADETRSMNAADAPAWDPGDGQTRDFRRPGFGQPDYRRPDSARGDFPRPDSARGDFRRPDPGRGDFGQRDTGWGDAGHRDVEHRDVEQAGTPTARPFGTVRMGSDGHEVNGGPGGTGDFAGDGPGNGRHGGGPGKHGAAGGGGARALLRDHPRWVVMVASSVAVFVVVMLAITLIEFGTGKPIDASVWGRKASGTTLGDVTGSHSNGTVAPTVSPTPTQSATPGVSQTAQQPNSSPAPTPTPSSVPSVSPSQGVPASVAPTAPAQLGSPPGKVPAQSSKVPAQ